MSTFFTIALSLSALNSSKVLAQPSGTKARQQQKISKSKLFVFAIAQELLYLLYTQLIAALFLMLTYLCARECVQVIKYRYYHTERTAIRLRISHSAASFFLGRFGVAKFVSKLRVSLSLSCSFRQRPRHNLRPVSARILLTISADFVL